jgi:hypothetical protein
MGRGNYLFIHINDPRYAQQTLGVDCIPLAEGKETSLPLRPAQIIEGRVLAADTGQPIPHAVVSIGSSGGRRAGGTVPSKFQADDQGRFIANPFPGESFSVTAHAPEGQPYPSNEVEFDWPKGAVKKAIDIPLTRGVLLSGKVIEWGTGRPLAGANIQCRPARGGNARRMLTVASQQDGAFQLAIQPGTGHLLIFGPTSDYVLEEIGSRRLDVNSRPGGTRFYAHAIIPYESKPGDPLKPLAVELRPGTIVKGRVQGPQGQAVTDASLVTMLHIDPGTLMWRGKFQPQVRDGSFELHGIDPNGSTRIHILDPEREWGTTFDISGKQPTKEVTIRLEPCGQASARFVGPDGKPLANFDITSYTSLVVTPGPPPFSRNVQDEDKLAADEAFLSNFDSKHYGNDLHTDASGRVTLISLIPGALYRISDMSTMNVPQKGTQMRKDFTVKSGQTLDLGDIVVEKPKSAS